MLSVTTPELLLSGNYTEEGIALLSSIYMIFYAGGQLVNGFLGDMLSPKVMILGGIGLGGAAMILFPFLPYQALRVICFALLGFGLSEDAIHSPNESYGLAQFDKGLQTIPLFYKHFSK